MSIPTHVVKDSVFEAFVDRTLIGKLSGSVVPLRYASGVIPEMIFAELGEFQSSSSYIRHSFARTHLSMLNQGKLVVSADTTS